MRFIFLFLFLTSCIKNDHKEKLDDLNSIKKDFISSVLQENVDESPFHMNYSFRTVFFSQDLVSFLGEILVYDHLPHGWSRFEGKTLYRIHGKFQEITLDDLFETPEQKEFLRSYCENNLKYKNEQGTYFSGKEPLMTKLDQNCLRTFVVDRCFLIIIFQPYQVGGCGDGPFVVKIPYDELKNQWNPKNPLINLLTRVLASKEHSSSWNESDWEKELLK